MPSANARWYKVGDALLVLSEGDITQWSGDALVNAGRCGVVVECCVLASVVVAQEARIAVRQPGKRNRQQPLMW